MDVRQWLAALFYAWNTPLSPGKEFFLMKRTFFLDRVLLVATAVAWLVACPSFGEEAPRSRQNLTEPVLRVAKITAPSAAAHPLDPALDLARDGLNVMRGAVLDYTCTLVKRERVNGQLGEYEYMYTKVRNRRVVDGRVVTPFSVYMYFLRPASSKGREVLYVEGHNNNKLVAREGGTMGRFLPAVWLQPTGMLAMRGQLYPITDVGIENLVLKLIERGEQEKRSASSNCQVTFHENAKINGRSCTLLQLKHERPGPGVEFHLAQIFIDDELNVPIRYAAFDFPEKPGDPLPVLEEYTYLNLQVNVGLTDKDFDYTNSDYGFR
jgi:hypothetical protein